MKFKLLWRVLLVATAFVALGCGGTVSPADDTSQTDVPVHTQDVSAPDTTADVPVGPTCSTNDDCVDAFETLGPCEVAVCDTGTQRCVRATRKDYSVCQDDNACTYASYCLAGD